MASWRARASEFVQLIDKWLVSAHNSPRFLDWSASVLKPEGATVADSLIETILYKEMFKARDLPPRAMCRPLEGYRTSMFDNVPRQFVEHP